jgi:hypothetical protein
VDIHELINELIGIRDSCGDDELVIARIDEEDLSVVGVYQQDGKPVILLST